MRRVFAGVMVVVLSAYPCAAESFYGGLRFGSLSKGDGGVSHDLYDPPKCLGAQFGYRYWRSEENAVDFALEIDGNFSVVSGKISGRQADYLESYWVEDVEPEEQQRVEDGWSWDVASVGLYQIIRAGGKAYFLGKVGVLSENVTVVSNIHDESEAWGWSAGMGVGACVTNVVFIELEGVTVDKELAWFGVSVGVNF